MKVTVASWNPLTLQENGRLQEILETFKVPVVALQGTKIKKGFNGDCYRVFRVGVYDVYEWGWARRRYSNRSAGICLALDRRYFPRCCCRVFSAPAMLQGRGGAVRAKLAGVDLTFVVTYFPPSVMQPTHINATVKLAEWVETLITKLPNRTCPIMLGDMNARLGMHRQRDTEEWVLSSETGKAIGAIKPEKENLNGEVVRGICERQKLAVIGTHFKANDTYYGLAEDIQTSSRIDYQIIPEAALSKVLEYKVDLDLAKALQKIPDRRLRDHAPTLATYELALTYEGEVNQSTTRWDKDKLMAAVRHGDGVDEFMQEVADELYAEGFEKEWEKTEWPWESWDLLNGAIQKIAKKHYRMDAEKTKKNKNTRKKENN